MPDDERDPDRERLLQELERTAERLEHLRTDLGHVTLRLVTLGRALRVIVPRR